MDALYILFMFFSVVFATLIATYETHDCVCSVTGVEHILVTKLFVNIVVIKII